MANKYKLTLDPIVDVKVNLSLKSAARKGFNLGLIIGTTNVYDTTDPETSEVTIGDRLRIYGSIDEMLADGFTTSSAEYKAATLYFGASSQPDRLAVGLRRDGETALQAFTACREANSEWYVGVVIGALESEIQEIAAYTEACEPSTIFFYTTQNENVLAASEGVTDIFSFLQSKKYRRSLGLYCGHEDTPNAVVALMGYAMGANTGTADSAFTLAYKTLVGVATDDLSTTQVNYAVGSKTTTGHNGNVYITRAEDYDIVQQGYMADKTSFDEILNLDMLKNEITLNVMDLLYQSKKIPQTEAGMTSICGVIERACDMFVAKGFIAPGQWNGAKCLALQTGDYLPAGYIVQHDSIDDQPQAQRDARIAPPIYVCIKLAGAIEFVTVEVNVNR